ncbi:VRR-NUC domain-containing protein [Paenibacillus cellulosilyticus]|uniref:VRR-NUC domain-containing protein n=1 Tax=Paenibacillus cellulosilyticus TaxID=375489 RepID=A0A2V2YE39_9BACL|nr:VRR-NUC domain-containing protein [Paenibacillus cellulosilyticus]PWV90240.1 VRR-NUC domain-containing protein [Paenibacillus cellulosilyticus]QKS43398.1 VRR-NUC domain-containing protein [Paenibacillus cellulosilyticus]
MRERTIEKRFCSEVKKHGGQAFKFIPPGYAGAPDRVVLCPGWRTYFVELKAPGEKLRPLQVKRAEELRKMGYPVYCIDSIAGIDDFIAEVFGHEV